MASVVRGGPENAPLSGTMAELYLHCFAAMDECESNPDLKLLMPHLRKTIEATQEKTFLALTSGSIDPQLSRVMTLSDLVESSDTGQVMPSVRTTLNSLNELQQLVAVWSAHRDELLAP